jgi:hypothetical protein
MDNHSVHISLPDHSIVWHALFLIDNPNVQYLETYMSTGNKSDPSSQNQVMFCEVTNLQIENYKHSCKQLSSFCYGRVSIP